MIQYRAKNYLLVNMKPKWQNYQKISKKYKIN